LPDTKKKTIEVYLDSSNKLNITIIKENNQFKRFAINYSARFNGKWHPVYRVDNHHSYLHEQRLWQTKKPIPLPEYDYLDLKEVFDIFFQKVKQGCLRFRQYFEDHKKIK